MSDQRPARLVMLFMVACVLLFYPLLSLFDRVEMVGSMPTLFVYFFCVWLLIIGFLWWLGRNKKER